jgi:hypothetical protein
MDKAKPLTTAEQVQRHLEREGNGSITVGDVKVETYKGLIIIGAATPRGEDWKAPEPAPK